MRVLGLWNTTLKRGLRPFFHWLFFTALAALEALSLPALLKKIRRSSILIHQKIANFLINSGF
jgi:hypothetical protein